MYLEYDSNMYWNAFKTIINHPPVSTIFTGGVSHSQSWVVKMTLFYPHERFSEQTGLDFLMLSFTFMFSQRRACSGEALDDDLCTFEAVKMLPKMGDPLVVLGVFIVMGVPQ